MSEGSAMEVNTVPVAEVPPPLNVEALPALSTRGLTALLRDLPDGMALVIRLDGYNRRRFQRHAYSSAAATWGEEARMRMVAGQLYIWRAA